MNQLFGLQHRGDRAEVPLTIYSTSHEDSMIAT